MTVAPSLANEVVNGEGRAGVQKSARMLPCCLAISQDTAFGTGDASHTLRRRWRALAIDDHHELTSGELVTNMDDPLMVVRDKAMLAARSLGYEPQQFVLDKAN